MNETRTPDPAKLAAAQARLIPVAQGFAVVLGPVSAANVLFGAGLGVLLDHLGKEGTLHYLDTLRDELQRMEAPPEIAEA